MIKQKVIKEAVQEMKQFKKAAKISNLRELEALHPVNDETTETTIIIREDNDIKQQVNEYHKIMMKDELSCYSVIKIGEKQTLSDIVKEILEKAIDRTMLCELLMKNYKIIKHDEVTGRCFEKLFYDTMSQYFDYPTIICVKDEDINYDLDKLVEITLDLMNEGLISKYTTFNNEIITKIIEYHKMFFSIWKEVAGQYADEIAEMQYDKEKFEQLVEKTYLE